MYHMEFLKKFNVTGVQVLKIIGIIVGALVILTILIPLLSNAPYQGMGGVGLQNPSMPEYGGEKMMYDTASTLSTRNVAEAPQSSMQNGYSSGDASESFEVKEFSAQYETRNLERDCESIRTLKTREDVVFENAREYDRGCFFTFKVEKKSVPEILGILRGLNPKELSEQSYTIKREVDDYTSAIQILEQKLATLDATLLEATNSYTDITGLATKTGDVESLAKIIESKLTIIERLTIARIDTSNQLEQMNRTKTEALDRLTYTYFSVSMVENEYVDGEAIRDSWKLRVQQSVITMNMLLQDLSIGLVTLLFTIIKFALYFGIILFVIRFGWLVAKRVWKSE